MKKFFNKAVLDFKFNKAGDGHRLDEEKKRRPSQTSSSTTSSVPSGSSASAGRAAIGRLDGGGGRVGVSGEGPTARQSPKTSPQIATGPGSSTTNGATADKVCVAVGSTIIRLVCPICQQSVPYSEAQDHMSLCLQEEYIKEPLSASVQMIHTLCTDTNKRKNCVETLCKYLENIIEHPGEQKYRKIRTGNKTFSEKVSSVAGADLFLEAVGFEQTLLPHQDSEKQFYVLPLPTTTADTGGSSETESGCGVGGASSEGAGEEETTRLSVCRELLCNSEPLKPTLDRQVALFRPSPHVNNFNLSGDFYQLSVEEIRREQKLKVKAVEKNQQLRTKVMRERDEVRAATKFYRHTLIRVRLPDGLFLQAAFRPLEKLQAVREVVSGVLADGTLTFSLSAFGQQLKSDSDTLAALGLVPSAVMNLSWNGAGPHSGVPYLDSGLLQRIQRL